MTNNSPITTTSVLPPFLGIRMAWLLTGAFRTVQPEQNNEAMNTIEPSTGNSVADAARNIQNFLENYKDCPNLFDKEKNYLFRASISIFSHLRSLSSVYSARELNFKENEVLRVEYLNFVRDNINFGSEIKDWLKALPTMAVGGVTGIAIAQTLDISGILFWLTGILLALVGFIFYEWWMVYSCRRKQWTYVMLDFERTLYYKQYLKRVKIILHDLYFEVNTIHQEIFDIPYPVPGNVTDEEEYVDAFIECLFQGVKPTFCSNVYDHIQVKGLVNRTFSKVRGSLCDNPITPELWPYCETGDNEVNKHCPYNKRPSCNKNDTLKNP